MKKSFLIFVLVLCSAIVSIGLYDHFTNKQSYPPNVVLAKLLSKRLGQEREIIIHLPRNYDARQKYPVMYVLDASAQDGHIANKFEVLSAAGYVPEVIVVGIPNMTAENRAHDMIPPDMMIDTVVGSPMGKADKFLGFMEYELFPFMEKHYSASKTRLFAGHSRGGLLVMYSLVYKPDMFQGRFCFSPALWRDNNKIVSSVADVLDSRHIASGFLYISLGDKESGKMEQAFIRMADILKKRSPEELTWYADRTRNSDHQNNAQASAAIAIAKWNNYQAHTRMTSVGMIK